MKTPTQQIVRVLKTLERAIRGLEEPAGRTKDLMDAGLSRDTAEAVGVCEVALIAAEVAPKGLIACGPHVATVIVEPAVFEAAMEHCTTREKRIGWERIADAVPEPARGRCLALARACGGPQAA